MITEDYVSFEIAKLLKKKGFDEATIGYYYTISEIPEKIKFFDSPISIYHSDGLIGCIHAPTLQMAMKWLREVHKLYCDIKIGDGDFVIDIISLKDGEFGCEVAEPESCVYPTYEEAAEAVIKCALENLV